MTESKIAPSIGVQVGLTVLRTGLLAAAWACVAVYVAWPVSTVIASFYRKEEVWAQLRAKLLLGYSLSDAAETVLSGRDNTYLSFGMLPPVVAAMCVTLALLLPRTPLCGKASSFGQAIWRPAKRFLNWQVPLRAWWLSWCGGLSLGEAFLWCSWLVIHAVSMWDYTLYVSTKFEGWSDMGMRMHVPHSVQVLPDLSLACAWLIYLDLAIALMPISHSTFLNRLLGIPYAGLIRFHRWVGHFVLWMTLGHGLFLYWFWISDPTINFFDGLFDWGDMYNVPSLAGTMALAFALLLWFTSLAAIRRRYFNLFIRCHIIGFIGFMAFSMMHYIRSWIGFFPGMFLWAADLVMRSYYSHKRAWVTALRPAADGSLTHVEVTVAPKTFKDPMRLLGAHVFLRIPSLSRLDWHPFTVANVTVDAGGFTTLTVVIKAYNNWSKRLSQLAIAMAKGATDERAAALRVNLWRPFDEMHVPLERYGDVLVVAGGIAVTPVAAMLRKMLADVRGGGAAAWRRVRVVFVARSADEFNALGADVLSAAKEHDWLDLQLHFTGSGSRPLPMADSATSQIGDAKGAKADPKGMPPPLDTSASISSADSVTLPAEHAALHSSDDDLGAVPKAAPGRGAAFWRLISRCTPIDFLSDAQMTVVVLLSFFGGFMGFVLAQAMNIELHTERGMPVGLLYLLIVTVQCAGLPAFFVLVPVFVKRLVDRWRGKQPWTAAVRTAPGAPLDVPIGLDACGNLTVWGGGGAEAGAAIGVTHGRPDLHKEVQAFAEQAQAAGARAVVMVSGPNPMINAVSLAVSDVNGLHCCACAGSKPYLDIYKAAFEF